MRGRLTVGHLPLEENILGSNPSPATRKEKLKNEKSIDEKGKKC